jgi:hypothetical protein
LDGDDEIPDQILVAGEVMRDLARPRLRSLAEQGREAGREAADHRAGKR